MARLKLEYVGSVSQQRDGKYVWLVIVNRESGNGRMVAIAWIESPRAYKTEQAADINMGDVLRCMKIEKNFKHVGFVRR